MVAGLIPRVLSQRMEDHNSNPAAVDAMSRVRGEITQVKTVMIENIEKVLDRGDKLELLVDKTVRTPTPSQFSRVPQMAVANS